MGVSVLRDTKNGCLKFLGRLIIGVSVWDPAKTSFPDTCLGIDHHHCCFFTINIIIIIVMLYRFEFLTVKTQTLPPRTSIVRRKLCAKKKRVDVLNSQDRKTKDNAKNILF